MNSSFAKEEYTVDVGKSSEGAFVRITHLPTQTSLKTNPIGSRDPNEVIEESKQNIQGQVQKLPAPYSLWRLDDNDNESLMMKYWLKEVAERVRQMYEDRGHKQTYFIRKHDV